MHTEASLAGASVSQRRSAEGQSCSSIFHTVGVLGTVRGTYSLQSPSPTFSILSFSGYTHSFPLNKVHARSPYNLSSLPQFMLGCRVMVSRLKEILITHENEPLVALVYTLTHKPRFLHSDCHMYVHRTSKKGKVGLHIKHKWKRQMMTIALWHS